VASHRAETPPLRRSRKRQNRRSPNATQRVHSTSLSAPHVGIVSALGLATIAAPLSGVLAAPAPKLATTAISAIALAPAPAFPRVTSEPTAVDSLRVVADVAPVAIDTPSALKAPRTLIVTRATRSNERSVLPGCDGIVASTAYSNGQLPDGALCTLWTSKHRLRADAAVALAKLNIAYKQAFGSTICLTDSYRTLASQQRLKAQKGYLAARPGTSQHGLGLAIDLCGGAQTGYGTRYTWLRDNAPIYGWDNPDWALPGGSGPHEPWHWEFSPH
jgi:D-alanyl-D-alanine carboxypeptidase